MNTPTLRFVDYSRTCNRSLATIVAQGQDRRVVVYDHAANKSVFDAELAVPCSCSDLSNDGRYIAIGYWDRTDIDVWDLETSRRWVVNTPSRVSRVLFDQTADWLVYQSERGTYATLVAGTAQTKIMHAEDLNGPARRVRDNTMLVPLRRKGRVAVIRN